MLKRVLLTGTLALAAGGAHAQTRAPVIGCAALAQAAGPALVIARTEMVTDAPAPGASAALTGAAATAARLPPHCLVQGTIAPRLGAGGKPYGIGFQLRLPAAWNGSFLFQGGGGLDGFVAPALGPIPSHGSTAPTALARGMAVVTEDSGHQGTDASFALDQQARLDYEYNAIGEVTATVRRLLALYYASAPAHSYFMGCSNGGKEGMIAAQRFPTEFDGVVAGAPAFNLTNAGIAEAWDEQALMRAAPADASGHKILSRAFSPADLQLLQGAVLKACDADDGVIDGLIANPRACHFDPAVLQCQGDKTDACLSVAQVTALHDIFAGPHDSHGTALYSDWPWDGGLASPGWRHWKLGDATGAHPNALNVTLGFEAMASYFITPPDPSFDPLTFDFDRDPPRLAQTAALNNATSTFYSSFVARGGKLVVFQGGSDPVFSANDIARYFDRLAADNGGAAAVADWARLFIVPGMNHCGDGQALDDIDPLTALTDWVEHGTPPARLLATGKAFPGRSRPICPYPQSAHYAGSGDSDQAASFVCR